MIEFTARYQQLSDRELLEILANASSYQAAAVATAQQELASRKLSEAQIATVNSEVEREKELKKTQALRRKEENETLKRDFFALFKNVNPFAKELELYEKQIRFMCWFYAGIALYTIVTNFSLMGFYMDDMLKGKIDADFFIYVAHILSIVLGAILFWKRKMLGWILITFFMVTGIAGVIVSFIYHVISPTPQYYTFIDDVMQPSNIVGMLLISAFFYGTNMYVLLKEKVKSVFKIDTTIAVVTITAAAAIQVAIWITLFVD
ncbi:hypothetical protein [Kordia jejudonensis]|uniref:hypothetical protein n=1 Tax=Kordia jejudonensis TaxID=1348245 RepID=UPI000629682B|nr:hypothetical protein [Kordia jejudonensis]